MPLTRVFKFGNSQVVRIPAEIVYADTTVELQISRHGDVITIFPARPSFMEAVAVLRTLPKPPLEERTPIEPPERM